MAGRKKAICWEEENVSTSKRKKEKRLISEKQQKKERDQPVFNVHKPPPGRKPGTKNLPLKKKKLKKKINLRVKEAQRGRPL